VILATDCDREGQLIGQEILEHLRYRGTVQRALFTAQDPKSLRQAFDKLRPNGKLRPLYEAAIARQQADQILNLSLTRTAPGGCSPAAHLRCNRNAANFRVLTDGTVARPRAFIIVGDPER
jgi:DNA topoisomerase IA